ncbi:MAG: hypothetical protein BRC31_00125, partial [Actinobacteria bacterium QS_5_72_10]
MRTPVTRARARRGRAEASFGPRAWTNPGPRPQGPGPLAWSFDTREGHGVNNQPTETGRWEHAARGHLPRAVWLALAAAAVIAGGALAGDVFGGAFGPHDQELVVGPAEEAGGGQVSSQATAETPERAPAGTGTTQGLAHRHVWSLAEGRDGRLWAGTSQGLSWFDGESWRTDRREDGPGYSRVVSLAIGDDGSVWAATEGSRGVLRFHGGDWTAYTTADGLADNAVSSVAIADDGTVWAATLDGLSRGRNGEWTTFTPHDGLAGDAVTSVAVADDGTVWAGTHDGLSRFHNDSWTSYTGRGSLPGG